MQDPNAYLNVATVRPQWRGTVPSVLFQRCDPVPVHDESKRPIIREVVEEMFITLYANFGVGLAAPQVGILWRLVVVDLRYLSLIGRTPLSDDEAKQLVLFNPVLTNEEAEQQSGREACLSIPGFQGNIDRHERISVSYESIDGTPQLIIAEGFLARVIQHEIDHLDGVLYADHATEFSPITGSRFAARAAEALTAAGLGDV